MSYSKSIFFIPVWFNDFDVFTEKLSKEEGWKALDVKQSVPRYFLNYVTRIAKNKSLFQVFEFAKPSSLNVYMFEEELQLENIPQIECVRMSCFATGVGFLEFWLDYKGMTPEKIADFAYLFKKAAKMCGKIIKSNARPLYDVAKDLLPKKPEAQLFFTVAEPFKYDCFCFHFFHLDECPENDERVNERLYRLSRGYNNTFAYSSFESAYDMVHKASENDYWGGSPEGLVNVLYDIKQDDSDYYLHKYKLTHLQIDYYFLYLMLLNQRLSAIQYINEIASFSDQPQSKIELLNKRIVKLKTTFAFNVLSDDKNFQNVYSRMYSILEIEHLLSDIVDNESQMQMIQNTKLAKAEQMSSKFLFGISILSLFSALIDASSYFDRFQALKPLSTGLGLLCVCVTIVLCVAWLIKSRK